MTIQKIAQQMMARGKGILAADESTRTATKRLGAIHVESTEETRRQFRELFLGAQGIENYLNAVILYDETIRQSDSNGTPFVKLLADKGILPGIKVDGGTEACPGSADEKVTKGLDGLENRLAEYVEMGAVFTKWRSVITIGDGIPTDECIGQNADSLAKYAKLAQDAGLVPIIEPEVLLNGDHTQEQSERVMVRTFNAVFDACNISGVDVTGAILKTSMVLPGSESGATAEPNDVADSTSRALNAGVPKDLAGVVFLSGGQKPDDATINLNAIAKKELPWTVTFSFSRALQNQPLDAWKGARENVEKARKIFIELLEWNARATLGRL